MLRSLPGKRILITGASSGIGREIALASAAAGARLLLTSDQAEPLRLLAEEIAASGVDVIHVAGDITSAADRSVIFAAARDHFGGMDILVNNAGVGGYAQFLDEDPEVVRRIMEVNFFALAECCRAGIPLLLRGRQPLIVNVSSMFGRRGVPNFSSYCASKFAVFGFSESLRPELAAMSIDLMLVLPGITRTAFGNNLLSGNSLDLTSGMDPKILARSVLRGIRRNRRELQIGRDSKRLILFNRLFPSRIFPSWLEWRFVAFARHIARPVPSEAASIFAAPTSDPPRADLRSLRARRIQALRAAEQSLPATIFSASLFPFVVCRTMLEWRSEKAKRPSQQRLPETFCRSPGPTEMFRARYERFAVNLIRHWPDRLQLPRWQRRCRIFGEDRLDESLASGRSVILATLHYGGLRPLFYWLRSRRLPVAAMADERVVRRDAYRRYFDSLADAANGLSHAPSLFGTAMSDLFDARDSLTKPGNALLIAIDLAEGGHPATIKFEDVSLNVQLGAFSLAGMTSAIVLPCLFRADRQMGCQIHFGQPVPEDLLKNRKGYAAAAQHVLNNLLPLVRECPEQIEPEFARRKA